MLRFYLISELHVQRFRVRHGLSCVIGLVWPVGASCYSQAALSMPLSKLLYILTVSNLSVVTLLFTWVFSQRQLYFTVTACAPPPCVTIIRSEIPLMHDSTEVSSKFQMRSEEPCVPCTRRYENDDIDYTSNPSHFFWAR